MLFSPLASTAPNQATIFLKNQKKRRFLRLEKILIFLKKALDKSVYS